MLPDIEIVEAKSGMFALFKNSDFISNAIRRDGFWGELEKSIAIIMAEDFPGSCVLDIGANLGAFSVPVAKHLASKQITVYSFEPQRIVFQQLCANIFLNRIDNCVASQVAVGKTRSFIELPKIDYHKTTNIGSVSCIREIQKCTNVSYDFSKTESVEVVSLEELVFNENCSFVKIDVEGFEADVIAGAEGFFVKHGFPPILFEEWRDGKFTGDAGLLVKKNQIYVRSKLKTLGYQFLELGLEVLAQHPEASTELSISTSKAGHRFIKKIR
jgi:FkbM family methyltransferase